MRNDSALGKSSHALPQMTVVYVVKHVQQNDDGIDEAKIVGVFTTSEAAEGAILQLRTKPGFVEHPDGFHVDAYELDWIEWSAGLVSAPPASE